MIKRLRPLFLYKCPNCEKGKIYEKSPFFGFGKMKESCSHCGHIYEWEPGFFYGAMYVSYALGVATLVGVFIICQFFFERAFDPWMIAWMIGTLLALAPYNHKISRVIWMYFFTRKGRSKTLVQQK